MTTDPFDPMIDGRITPFPYKPAAPPAVPDDDQSLDDGDFVKKANAMLDSFFAVAGGAGVGGAALGQLAQSPNSHWVAINFSLATFSGLMSIPYLYVTVLFATNSVTELIETKKPSPYLKKFFLYAGLSASSLFICAYTSKAGINDLKLDQPAAHNNSANKKIEPPQSRRARFVIMDEKTAPVNTVITNDKKTARSAAAHIIIP